MTWGDAFEAPVPPDPVGPEPQPDPNLMHLSLILEALQTLQQSISSLPAPQVILPEPDLSAVVSAVNGLKPGVDAQEIAAALKRELAPALTRDTTSEVLTDLAAALKKLDFRLKGDGARSYAMTPPASLTVNNATNNPVPVTVTDSTLTVDSGDQHDLFGTQIVGSLNNLIEVHFDDAAYASYLSTTVSGAGAAATPANGRVQFATGTTANGTYIATTIDNAVYRPHFPTYAAFTAAWVTPPTSANDLAILGLGDLTNGLFIGYKGSQFGALYRKAGVDTFTALAPVGLNTSIGSIFKVEVGLFGYAGGRIRWWNPGTSTWQTIHVQPHSNAEPFFTNFDLPVTLQLDKNAGDATNVQVNTACWGAGSSSLQGRITDPITDRSLAANVRAVIVGKTTGGGGGYVPVKVDPSGAVPVSQGSAAAHNAGWETRDYFTGGEVLADQTAAGAALTFTFSSPVNLVQVMTTGVDGRVDPFGGTPSSSAGIRVLADTPTLIPVQATTVKVFAASGAVNVVGFRY